MTVASVLQPLISRNIFPNEETAIRKLTLEYVIRQIDSLRATVSEFEHKYNMSFSTFEQYLHERAQLLTSPELDESQRKRLSRAVMLEEMIG